MNGKEIIDKLKSTYLWTNLLAMVLVVVLLVLGVKFGLNVYTHHGDRDSHT